MDQVLPIYVSTNVCAFIGVNQQVIVSRMLLLMPDYNDEENTMEL